MKIIMNRRFLFSFYCLYSCLCFCDCAFSAQTRQLDDFKILSVNIPAQVFYKTDKIPHVKIIASTAMMPFIITNVKNDELMLQMKLPAISSVDINEKIIIEVFSSRLESILLTSSANIIAENMRSETAHFILAGSGTIKASGAVEEAVVNVTGSGNLDIAKLGAKKLQIDLLGSGNISAYASDYVHVHNMNNGQVRIAGNPPERKIEKHGTGDIVFK